MLTLFLTVFGVSCGFSAGFQSSVRCGDSVRLPMFPFSRNYTVYFIPSNGGSRKLVMDKGQPMDPRIKKISGSFHLTNLTLADVGTFDISLGGERFLVFKLEISDCAERTSDTVTFKPKIIPDTKMRKLVWDEYNTQSFDVKPDYMKIKNSDNFKISESQVNLAKSRQIKYRNRRFIKKEYFGIAFLITIVVGLLYCCCKTYSCNENPPQTEEALDLTNLRETSPENAARPTASYPDGNPPERPGYPAPYTSVFNHQSSYQPVNTNYPQPRFNLNLLQSEVPRPADQGSAAAPTFSLEFLSSNNEPRFNLRGLNVPSASHLSSNTPSCNVYNSDKLNCL